MVALTIEDRREGTRFVHASDVQGPLSPVAAAYLARQRPTLLYLSGPPAYLESQLGSALIDRGIDQLLRIIDQTGLPRDPRSPRAAGRGATRSASGGCGRPGAW